MLIATDYLEQIVSGLFSIVGVKELDYSVLIPENFEENEENENFDADYYKIEVCILEDDTERDGTFIVKASDAEIAKEIIIRFLTMKKLEDNNNEEMTVTIISAKTIPCNYVIEYEFSLEYLNNENES